MPIVHHSTLELSDLLESVRRVAAQSPQVRESGISYWGNHELSTDSDIVPPGLQLHACLSYAAHHQTLPLLHEHIDPVGGTVWVRYSQGEARARVVNLTLTKVMLAASDVIVRASQFEYEAWLWNNGQVYAERLGAVLDHALWTVFGRKD